MYHSASHCKPFKCWPGESAAHFPDAHTSEEFDWENNATAQTEKLKTKF